MATFLSAVTATTLQFRFEQCFSSPNLQLIFFCSYTSQQTKTEQAVNLLWLASLVFSIASATNSQMAYYLNLAHYRTPKSRSAQWALACITGTPVVYIIAAVITFSAGLVCFTFAIFSRHGWIPITIATLTSFISFVLFVVIFSFSQERYGPVLRKVSRSGVHRKLYICSYLS